MIQRFQNNVSIIVSEDIFIARPIALLGINMKNNGNLLYHTTVENNIHVI